MNDAQPLQREAAGSGRVLTMSTIGFTVMFAVWMMFGILQKPIRAELGLSEEQYSWILAAAILNGSMWRLPAGILADRLGGRKLMVFLLSIKAPVTVSRSRSCASRSACAGSSRSAGRS